MKAKIEEWETDSLAAPEGAVNLAGGITVSDPAGGCGEPGCNCSPGWWISFSLPVDTAGIVKGWVITFDNVRDMRAFLETGRAKLAEWLERPF